MSAVQAYLPRPAFDALDLPLIVRLARLAGVDQPRVEYSTYRIPSNIRAGSTRVTCSFEMALALVEAFKQQAARTETANNRELLTASADAVAALLAAIDEYHRPGGSTGTEPTPY
jgi:hypothetical protein